MGLNVAQTGSSMGMELLMAARVISGVGHSAKSAGSVFGRGGSTATGTGAAASGFASGFASRLRWRGTHREKSACLSQSGIEQEDSTPKNFVPAVL